MAEEKYLEVSVVAKRLNLSVSTIYRHRTKEDSPLIFVAFGAKKGYRITRSSYDAMVSGTSGRL